MGIPGRIAALVALLLAAAGLARAQDMDQSRLAALDRLSGRLEHSALAGRLIERTPGAYVFVPEARDLPALPVLNPEAVARTSVGPRLNLRATYDASGEGVRVTGYSLAPRSAASEAAMMTPSPRATASPVERALATFQAQLSGALQPGTARGPDAPRVEIVAPGDDSMISQAADQAQRALDAAYHDAVAQGDDQQRRAAVRAIADVRQQLKAIYNTYDNYPPWNYEKIFANSKSVVALAEPGQHRQALCSGVLIAPDLVLTAGHCFRQHHPEDLQVWFGFVETADGQFPAPVGFPITALVAPPSKQHEEFLERAARERFDAEVPDFAIVRFDGDQGRGPPAEVAPQCLRSAHISRGRPLYVIGYPKGTRQMVHDNGRVYLPFRLRSQEFNNIRKEIEVDFAALEDGERLRLVDEFVASYVRAGQGASAVFELHDTRFGGQPKLGIVADTFQGNSGSPVFDRDNHCIAGILTGGAPDIGQRLGASWQFHETVLPMPAILSSLEQPETVTLLEAGSLDIR
jgi:Trypsin